MRVASVVVQFVEVGFGAVAVDIVHFSGVKLGFWTDRLLIWQHARFILNSVGREWQCLPLFTVG